MKIARIIIFFLPFFSSAQTSKYFIQFTDKNNSPYSVSSPSAFLSSRAIARRASHGIAVQPNDLPVNQNYIDSVVAKGAVIRTRSKWFNGVTIEADTNTLHAVTALPFVQQSTKVFRVRSFSDDQHPERKFQSWPIRDENNSMKTQSYSYGQSFDQIHIMHGDYLHDSGFHGENMVIAILDAGFYHVDSLPAFDSLRVNGQILGTWDFVTGDSSVYEDYDHGMSVLSTIGGNIPGQLVGTAPKAGFWLLRTEDIFSEHVIEEYNWDAGAEYADSVGADVITTSLGYTQFNNPAENHTRADMNGHTTPCAKAANIAFSKGMMVMASAGNDGGNFWQYIGTPADGDSVMAVGAVNTFGNYATFSSTGPSSDGDVKPNVAAVGQGTTISIYNGAIGNGNGTSFSCPVLAGSAACLWQAFPNKTNREIFDAIQRSASQALNPDSLLGYGIPNFLLADQLLGGVDVNVKHDEIISVFPNPARNRVYISGYSSAGKKVAVNIFDLPGRQVPIHFSFINNGSDIEADISSLSSGIYFLQFQDELKTVVKKLVKE
ncbi:MAG: S8 family serine peptidase [Bacteroidetes bacterium]|nr:S8 family serine peptidase [Bacteroidota bacterium]